MRSLISAFAAVILTVPGLAQDQVQAQEQPQESAQKTPPKGIVKLAKGVWGKLMAPDSRLDSMYVFQPAKGWDVAVSYRGHWNGIGMEIPIELHNQDGEVFGNPGVLRASLLNRMSNHIGVNGGFGPLSIGYSFEVGKANKTNRTISFNWLSTGYGIQLYYGSLNESAISDIKFADDAVITFPDTPTLINTLRIDGYYAFNRKRFSYQAAFTGKMVQRKSAGSVIAGVKLHYCNIHMDDGAIKYMLVGTSDYTSYQFALGAGYSYNIVAYHRDAASRKDLRSLRNITFNLTAVPLLTFLDKLSISGGKTSVMANGKMTPNFLARAGMAYTFGHWYLNAFADFHYNYFNSTPCNIPIEDTFYCFNVNCRMFHLTASLQLHYRF